MHGRFAYRRTATFCYYMFYKNIANVLAMYLYTLVALASGERLFVQVYLEVYNIVFTALPIIIFGFNDQDVPKAEAALAKLVACQEALQRARQSMAPPPTGPMSFMQELMEGPKNIRAAAMETLNEAMDKIDAQREAGELTAEEAEQTRLQLDNADVDGRAIKVRYDSRQ